MSDGRTISEPYIARTNVVHRVAVEHEPYTIHPNNVRTLAIVTTSCGIGSFQGIPLANPMLNDGDRLCRRCERAAS